MLGATAAAQETIRNRPTSLSTLYSTQERLRRAINDLQQGQGNHPGNKFIREGIERSGGQQGTGKGGTQEHGMQVDITVDVPTHTLQVPHPPAHTTPTAPSATQTGPAPPPTSLASPDPAAAPPVQLPATELGLESADSILQRQVEQADAADKATTKGKKAATTKTTQKLPTYSLPAATPPARTQAAAGPSGSKQPVKQPTSTTAPTTTTNGHRTGQ